ncbi:HNH endonuclease signature motif containing protein [Rhizobium sp. CBN3]|uniref:HNH endonuclease signature motif containing protein n=1 Tax=Rhizobium sp. CBN3 TaxID=3058045 RepID=UPI0026711D2B|nr:HNH endonuclease signature motif containing protein [Rhizobium sp. CBN3]MDO3431165.1 HNH endonuclease signature motif containing protein [Rhizobium sp. CBN3]
MISAEQLREALHYDPGTGIFTWLKKVSAKTVIGRRAGTINKDGYRQISIYGRRYYEHRLAWFYMTGQWPSALIDHENLLPGDNRWSNLRSATKSQNAANTHVSAGNSVGMKGVSWHSGAQKYQAHICVDGKSIYLGLFEKADAAHAAYQQAANDQFKSFARAA